MKIFATCLLCLISSFLFAQQKLNVIQKDTINIHGYVYDHTGKPATGALIESRQLDLLYSRFRIITLTDSSGFFELKGAKPTDTLFISQQVAPFSWTRCPNKGSRCLVVYLPPPVIPVINAGAAILVTGVRKGPVKTPSFKIIPFEGGGEGWENPAVYPGGEDRFISFLKKQLRYPENAINHHIEGTVQIQFTISRDGSLEGFKILKGIGYGCDEEVIKAIKSSKKWSSAGRNGRAFSFDTSVAVEFKLVSQ